MSASYSFDRAADLYDATRAHPSDVADQITRSILDLAGATPDTHILEIGIGTGRIAAPLISRGLNVTGLDLSREMMNKLRAKFPGTPLQLAQGDASALPFPDATFDMALSVHVFHLIAAWRQAIGELKRVLRPGGLILHSTHARVSPSHTVTLHDKWHKLVEAHGEQWKRPGASSPEAVLAEFQPLGASVQEIEVARWSGMTTPQQEIADLAGRISSNTWAVSDEVLRATVDELTEWARKRFGALDISLPEEKGFAWQVFRFDHAPLLPESIRKTLERLGPILNATGAAWALGGSCNLALHGVAVTPHDIDIITDEDGAYRIAEALRPIAREEQPVQWGEGERIRSHRGLYHIGDVQVDVLGASELREDNGWTAGKPSAEWKTDTMTVPGTQVSLVGFKLEAELDAYRKMGREAKVKLIEERLRGSALACG